jgi:hypothetical protein
MWLPAVLCCQTGMSQHLPPPPTSFPPEIIVERDLDVVKIAPRVYTIETENEKVRVLRAKLSGGAKVPIHDHRPGLLVALTDVHLRLRTADNKTRDLHIPAGETRWLDGETHAEENLDIRACQFLFVEWKEPPKRGER